MSFDIRHVYRRQTLTPIAQFAGISCKPAEFFEKTGHRNAVLAHPNGDCETIDFVDMLQTNSLKSIKKLSFVKETTRADIYREDTVTARNVSTSILYGYCINLSEYPIAVFRGTGENAENVLLYVPCFWE